VGALIGWLYRTGLRRGAKNGNPAWLIVALAAYILRRDKQRCQTSSFTVPIKPGERIEISMGDLGSSVDS
jgi:hypothetical protein